MKYDFLIVGAGFAGLVLAERLSSQLGRKCLLIDRRDHIGGNSQDEFDEAGVLIHKYGPHYFRTDSDRIQEYLSLFTDWHELRYEIRSYTNGQYWNFPVNLNTFEQLIGAPATEEQFVEWLSRNREDIENPANSEEVVLSQVGRQFYELFFRGYTIKQWGVDPREIDPAVCGRISVRTDRNNSYVSDRFQALPLLGYHKMFDAMLAAGSGIELLLGTSFESIRSSVDYDRLIYTGSVDEYYDYRFGRLPYRSLRFEHESYAGEELAERECISGKNGFWQPAVQVNYPNDFDYTRIVEAKHITGQDCDYTTIVKEYPEDFTGDREAYYPMPTVAAREMYRQYEVLAQSEPDVIFIGRLANYRYYNMDQVVERALEEFDKLKAGAC